MSEDAEAHQSGLPCADGRHDFEELPVSGGRGIVVGESRCRSYGRARGRDQGRWSGTGGRFDNREARAGPEIALRERKRLFCRQRIRFRNDVQHVRRGRIMSARGRARMGAQDKGAPVGGRREQLLSTAAALTVGVAFFSLWFWLLPGWLGFRVELAGTRRWRWLAAVPSVLGFAVALRLRLGLRVDGTRNTRAGRSHLSDWWSWASTAT
jgi:hypothetical protein